ncbi:uncharacterized protein [Solanum lycopersicum]|uniref:uncharacterized protein n=1 Tax=Solanum lycopersicum TaxID=4081 RepID=UPI003749091D
MKELVKDVHKLARLGFCLMSILDSAVTVQNGAESSFVEVKENQDSDPSCLNLRMAPYEALYGRKCRSLVGCFEVGEAALIGPDSVLYPMEKVQLIRDRHKKAQSRQKSYADGDEIWKERKLSHRYVGPYKILKMVGKVEYELGLLAELAAVHPVFHISHLKKCVGDPASVVPLESVAVKDSLSYEDVPVEILERQVRRLRNNEIASTKVLWRSQFVEGATWEAEAAMKAKYPHLFPSDSTLA